MQSKPLTKTAVIKTAVFSLLIIIITCYVTKLVVPKFLLENSSWPSTSTFTQFYEMEENTVDVLFVGSSCMSTAGIPQYLYDKNGIVSYNLASPEQTLITSYYWLEEALRFQSPSVVFLDNQMLFTFYENEPLNFKEPGQRKDFDYMKWSKVKMTAVHDICSLDSSQSELSYYLPIVRYHDRWKELGKPDFTYTPSKLYGFAPLYGSLHEEGEPDFVPLENTNVAAIDFSNSTNITNVSISTTDETASKTVVATATSDETILPLMQEYMDKIVALCKEKNIRLVLVTTVAPIQTQARHDLTAQYAAANNLTYLDFNTKELYEATQMDYFTDCYDTHHMTISGGEKISDYLANFVLSEGLATPKTSSDFESTKQYYQDFLTDLYQ